MTHDRVLVGVDGSAPSQSASIWAAAMATSFDAEVMALHAVSPWTGWEFKMAPRDEIGFDAAVRREVQEWTEPFAAAGVAHQSAVVEADAATGIIAEADHIQPLLIVVGNQGHRRWAPHHVGGVTSRLLRYTDWPTAVVPHPTHVGEREDGYVLVGVDGSAPSRRALRWAASHADQLGLKVRVITTLATEIWSSNLPSLAALEGTDPVGDTLTALDAFIAEAISEPLALRVSGEVVLGHPVAALTEPDEQASFIVLGRSGGSVLGDLVVGSVTRACVAQSTIPVVAVP